MRPLLLDPQLESAATLLLTATFCSCLYYHGRKCIIHVGSTFWPNFFNCWQVSQLYVVEQLKFLHLQNTRMTRNQVTYNSNILANCKYYYYTKYIIMQRISKSTLWNSTHDHLPNKRTIPIFEQSFFLICKKSKSDGYVYVIDYLEQFLLPAYANEEKLLQKARIHKSNVKGGKKRENVFCIFFLSSFLAVPTVQVEALVGHTTKLPCQMNSTKSSDVFLVLWYVDLDGKPIYR